MRDYFDEHSFVEVETPVLGRSTPEGARDYLVPSRVHPGEFYALPQSPQLYKQILMVAGYDRYVQVARCFRDEDLRADRQPEFTQLDVEMSFVDSEDVIGIMDGLVADLAKEFGHRRRAAAAANDLRRGDGALRSRCAGLAIRHGDRRHHRSGGTGRVSRVPRGGRGGQARPRLECQGGQRQLLAERHRRAHRIRHARFRRQRAGVVQGRRGRHAGLAHRQEFRAELLAKISERMQAAPGDMLLIVADSFEVSCKALYGLRKRFGEQLKLYKPGTMHFSWVVEFPMFALDAETQSWAAMHHPFTAPRAQDRELLATDPGQCRAQAYDLVINGLEAGGGTIRIHDQEVQSKVFGLLGIDREQPGSDLASCSTHCNIGAPPHGGIATGDRSMGHAVWWRR